MKPLPLIAMALLAIALGVGIGLYLRPQQVVAPPASEMLTIDDIGAEVLTPGGLYTIADIKANGTISPFDKYARTMLGDTGMSHAKPVVGDLRCPITGSRGTMTWQINGRLYYFCCPPCIIEFVRKAKTDPDSIPPPEEFLVTAENIDSLPPPTMGPTE